MRLAQLCLLDGKFAQAERLLLRALAVCKDHQEVGYPALAFLLQNLTVAYQGQGKTELAEVTTKRVEEIKAALV